MPLQLKLNFGGSMYFDSYKAGSWFMVCNSTRRVLEARSNLISIISVPLVELVTTCEVLYFYKGVERDRDMVVPWINKRKPPSE